MPKFIALVEDGDNSVHYVNLEQVVQMVHVPGAPLATVTTTDGRSFRIGEADTQKLFTAMDQPETADEALP